MKENAEARLKASGFQTARDRDESCRQTCIHAVKGCSPKLKCNAQLRNLPLNFKTHRLLPCASSLAA